MKALRASELDVHRAEDMPISEAEVLGLCGSTNPAGSRYLVANSPRQRRKYPRMVVSIARTRTLSALKSPVITVFGSSAISISRCSSGFFPRASALAVVDIYAVMAHSVLAAHPGDRRAVGNIRATIFNLSG